MHTITKVQERPASLIPFFGNAASIDIKTVLKAYKEALSAAPGFMGTRTEVSSDGRTKTIVQEWDSPASKIAFVEANRALIQEIKQVQKRYNESHGIIFT